MSSHDEPKVHKAYKVVVSMYYNVLQERNNKCLWLLLDKEVSVIRTPPGGMLYHLIFIRYQDMPHLCGVSRTTFCVDLSSVIYCI